MDFKTILQKITAFFTALWDWLKPHLSAAHQWRKRIWKKYQIHKIFLALILIVVIAGSVYLFVLAKSTNVKTLEEGLKTTTTIYDEAEAEAGHLKGQKGNYVALENIAPSVLDAVISTEDRRFYTHNGYDLKGIARAALRVVLRGNTSGGGGSTITQQLAKNAYLTQEQTFDRKARELFLAIEIEKNYTKDEILTMYLNTSYFGNGVWGVEDAAHRYFAKSAAELSLSEAATLAGMLKGPNIYNPKDDYEAAINRRNTVLSVMVENEKISQAEADAAAAEGLAVNDNYQESQDDYRYPYFFDAVIAEAAEKAKISSDDLLNNGYKIYTTLNQAYQAGMQDTFNNEGLFPANAADGSLVQTGAVAMNPTTGAIQGLVGGRGQHTFLGFNRATQASVQPGSTMKPLAVYTPALEAGWTPNSILQDEPLDYYAVENYSRTYAGEVPMYQAVNQSLNAPAVWLAREIGLETCVAKVEQFGLPLVAEDHYYGMVLGGLTQGVSPLQMAEAYTTFPNGGEKVTGYLITKIVDASGSIVYENSKTKTKAVTTKEVANEMTSMLQSVFSVGTGVNAKPDNYTMAGKTGTTETSWDGSLTKDQWIVGYTPDVVISMWIGFDESGEDHYLVGSSGTTASYIFKEAATKILDASPQTGFEVPDASQPEANATNEDGSSWWNNFGEKVGEGAEYWGGKIKEGTEGVKETVSDWWNSVFGN